LDSKVPGETAGGHALFARFNWWFLCFLGKSSWAQTSHCWARDFPLKQQGQDHSGSNSPIDVDEWILECMYNILLYCTICIYQYVLTPMTTVWLWHALTGLSSSWSKRDLKDQCSDGIWWDTELYGLRAVRKRVQIFISSSKGISIACRRVRWWGPSLLACCLESWKSLALATSPKTWGSGHSVRVVQFHEYPFNTPKWDQLDDFWQLPKLCFLFAFFFVASLF
jgi:hypothetical protein